MVPKVKAFIWLLPTVHTSYWEKLHFEFSRLNHPLDIKNLPWNIMEAHGTKPKGARLEKKADISA